MVWTGTFKGFIVIGMNIATGIYIVLGILALWIIVAYNGLVRARYRVKEALSDIDVQLKRRFDLIPNLVETVKGYMTHERSILENVTKARASITQSANPVERAKDENILSETLKTLFAVAENYPDLKANANFLELQRELADTENKIQAARRFYNAMVLAINTRVDSFPTSIIAGVFSFDKEQFFETAEGERAPVKVSF